MCKLSEFDCSVIRSPCPYVQNVENLRTLVLTGDVTQVATLRCCFYKSNTHHRGDATAVVNARVPILSSFARRNFRHVAHLARDWSCISVPLLSGTCAVSARSLICDFMAQVGSSLEGQTRAQWPRKEFLSCSYTSKSLYGCRTTYLSAIWCTGSSLPLLLTTNWPTCSALWPTPMAIHKVIHLHVPSPTFACT